METKQTTSSWDSEAQKILQLRDKLRNDLMKISKPSSNKQDSRKNNMLILSISKLDEDESSEISVFQLDKMDKSRNSVYHRNGVQNSTELLKSKFTESQKIINLKNKPKQLSKFKFNSSKYSCNPSQITSQNDNIKEKETKIVRVGAQTPIRPILTKISNSSHRGCFNHEAEEFYKQRELIVENRNSRKICNTPSTESSKKLVVLNTENSAEDIFKKLKMKLLLRAFIILRKIYKISTKLTIYTKAFKRSTLCSCDVKLRKIIAEYLHKSNNNSKNESISRNNDLQNRLRRSNNAEQHILNSFKNNISQKIILNRRSKKHLNLHNLNKFLEQDQQGKYLSISKSPANCMLPQIISNRS